MKKNILNMDKAIGFFHVGAYGFLFQSQHGDTFTSELDNQGRLMIKPLETEEKPE